MKRQNTLTAPKAAPATNGAPTPATTAPAPDYSTELDNAGWNLASKTLTAMAKRLGQKPQIVMFNALQLAEPKLTRDAAEKTLFDSLNIALEFSTFAGDYENQRREAIGFNKDGELVFCNGKTAKPVTLKWSVDWARKWKRRYATTEDIDHGCDMDGNARWFEMVAAAVK